MQIITDRPFVEQVHFKYLGVVGSTIICDWADFIDAEDIECEVVEPNIKLIEENGTES